MINTTGSYKKKKIFIKKNTDKYYSFYEPIPKKKSIFMSSKKKVVTP